MGIYDAILYPVYLFIFYYLFKIAGNKLEDPVLKIYYMKGFWIKALVVIPFAFFNSKISPGDSYVLYHVEGVNMYHLILKDLSNFHWVNGPGTEYDQSGLLADIYNLGYCRDINNFMVCRIVTYLSFFSFGKYIITCLLFSLISYTGVWKLYRFFYDQYPHLHKQLAIAILFLPTFVFWSSGILKDPLCTGALGWLTYSLYMGLFKKKNVLQNVLVIIFSAYVLSILKIYILVAYVPFFLLYLALKNLNLLKSTFAKALVGIIMLVGILVSFTRIMNELSSSMTKFVGTGEIGSTIQNYQANYASQAEIAQSNFDLGVEFDGSVASLIKMAPAAVVATLYRPFLWESRKLSTLLSSLESLALILLTLSTIRKGGLKVFLATLKDPAVMYCICFSLFFAIFVGATTPNFGTLCRYKIPCMPFYVIAMFLIQDIIKRNKVAPAATNKPAAVAIA